MILKTIWGRREVFMNENDCNSENSGGTCRCSTHNLADLLCKQKTQGLRKPLGPLALAVRCALIDFHP